MTTNLRQDVDFSSLIKKLGTSNTAGKHAEKRSLFNEKRPPFVYKRDLYYSCFKDILFIAGYCYWIGWKKAVITVNMKCSSRAF